MIFNAVCAYIILNHTCVRLYIVALLINTRYHHHMPLLGLRADAPGLYRRDLMAPLIPGSAPHGVDVSRLQRDLQMHIFAVDSTFLASKATRKVTESHDFSRMRSDGFPFIVWGSGGWTRVRVVCAVESRARRGVVAVSSLIPCHGDWRRACRVCGAVPW